MCTVNIHIICEWHAEARGWNNSIPLKNWKVGFIFRPSVSENKANILFIHTLLHTMSRSMPECRSYQCNTCRCSCAFSVMWKCRFYQCNSSKCWCPLVAGLYSAVISSIDRRWHRVTNRVRDLIYTVLDSSTSFKMPHPFIYFCGLSTPDSFKF